MTAVTEVAAPRQPLPAAGAGPEELEEPEGGLAHALREKLIELRTMDAGLATLSVVALAVVASATVTLLAVHYLPVPAVSTFDVSYPVPVVIATSVFLTLAWAYLLAGALHAHVGVKLLVLGLYTLSSWLWLPNDVHSLSGDAAHFLWDRGSASLGLRDVGLDVIFLLPLLVLWVTAAGLWLADRSHEARAAHLHHRHRLRLPTFVFCLAVVAAGLAVRLVVQPGISLGAYASTLDLDFQSLEFNLLIPVLYLTGTDFAEWSEVVSGRVAATGSAIRHVVRPWLLGAAVLAAAGVIVWDRVRADSLHGALASAGPAVVMLVVPGLLGLVALLRGASVRVPFWSLAVAALAGYVILWLAGYIAWSQGWGPTDQPVPTVAVDDARAAVGLLVWGPLLVVSGALLVRGGKAATGGLFVALCAVFFLGLYSSSLGTDLRLGWWIDQAHFDVLRGWAGAITAGNARIVLGAVAVAYALFLLLGRWRRARVGLGVVVGVGGGALTVVAIVLVGPAVFNVSYLGAVVSTRLGTYMTGHPLPGWTGPITMDSVRLAVAGLAVLYVLGLLVTGRLRRHVKPLRMVLVLLLGLIGLWLLVDVVFQGAMTASERFTAIQAAVLLVALIWDVATSGEYVTNVHGRHLPRQSRALMYFGYTMLVATTVLWSVSARVAPHGVGSAPFNSDEWPRTGIELMGTPLILTFFIVNLGAWLRRQRQGREVVSPGT